MCEAEKDKGRVKRRVEEGHKGFTSVNESKKSGEVPSDKSDVEDSLDVVFYDSQVQ